jgi:hypothetical protein
MQKWKIKVADMIWTWDIEESIHLWWIGKPDEGGSREHVACSNLFLKKKIAWWVVCSLRTSSGVITKRALMPGMRSACCGPLLCSSAVELAVKLGVNFTKP